MTPRARSSPALRAELVGVGGERGGVFTVRDSGRASIGAETRRGQRQRPPVVFVMSRLLQILGRRHRNSSASSPTSSRARRASWIEGSAGHPISRRGRRRCRKRPQATSCPSGRSCSMSTRLCTSPTQIDSAAQSRSATRSTPPPAALSMASAGGLAPGAWSGACRRRSTRWCAFSARLNILGLPPSRRASAGGARKHLMTAPPGRKSPIQLPVSGARRVRSPRAAYQRCAAGQARPQRSSSRPGSAYPDEDERLHPAAATPPASIRLPHRRVRHRASFTRAQRGEARLHFENRWINGDLHHAQSVAAFRGMRQLPQQMASATRCCSWSGSASRRPHLLPAEPRARKAQVPPSAGGTTSPLAPQAPPDWAPAICCTPALTAATAGSVLRHGLRRVEGEGHGEGDGDERDHVAAVMMPTTFQKDRWRSRAVPNSSMRGSRVETRPMSEP